MNVEIIEASRKIYSNLGEYVFAELRCGKQTMAISVAADTVQVVVTSNASHRAWRGMGKNYRSLTEALAGYKSAPVRAMIDTATRLWADRASIEVSK
jgi:hypothetical protein